MSGGGGAWPAPLGAVVTGLLLPSLLTWALGSLVFEQRGRGTGWWTAAVFLGQFVCPLVVLALSDALSGPGSALVVLGVVAVVASVVARTSGQARVATPASGS